MNPLNLLTWNLRSKRNVHRAESVLQHLVGVQNDLAALYQQQGQCPIYPSGVLDPFLHAVMVHTKEARIKERRRFIFVNYYSVPDSKQHCDDRLKFHDISQRELHPKTTIVLAGDLNRNINDAIQLASSLDFQIQLNITDNDYVTRQ